MRATTLRTQLIDALRPFVRDLVIAAPDRPYLGALAWLDRTACEEAGGPSVVRPALARLLAAFNRRPEAAAGGVTTHVRRVLPLDEPPSAAHGEVTDKRSINTRRVIERRAADVARLYAEPADPSVVLAGESP